NEESPSTFQSKGTSTFKGFAFALEGRGGLFVDKIEGCHSNVIGLSLPLLHRMLQELGYEVTDFWLRTNN
ncbi:MAG: septum formation inhibitor Maf, partial [Moorea sp. SIO1F2]|uniref:Maf family protein n=1 Tax=Moorena sp. SIO1F2 TaxID=2607819 RepID=UPI0013B67E10